MFNDGTLAASYPDLKSVTRIIAWDTLRQTLIATLRLLDVEKRP